MKTIIYKRKKIQIVMKEKIMIKFNFITNILILLLIIFGAISYADTNGVFIQAKDIVPGTFGADENSGNFTFPNNLIITKDLIVEGDIIYRDREITEKYDDIYINSDGDTIDGDLTLDNIKAKSFQYIN